MIKMRHVIDQSIHIIYYESEAIYSTETHLKGLVSNYREQVSDISTTHTPVKTNNIIIIIIITIIILPNELLTAEIAKVINSTIPDTKQETCRIKNQIPTQVRNLITS